ncbi:helix-turn-helix domain-containing protein [Georgenia sp. AZ-5]|uniref:helix-turn-helix domain-containing protein n=1 Tax=Georgenia sp. AZ-5 TaxID=3367526 RepID=UPI0037552865
MDHPTQACSCCAEHDAYCDRCDIFFGIDGIHVTAVGRDDDGLTVTVEAPRRLKGCRRCGVVAVSHGRRTRVIHDISALGAPVRVIWRKRTWSCPDPDCQVGVFSEDFPPLAARRAKLTTRAIWWAINQMRREHASVQGLARQLGVDWHTVWDAIKPELETMAKDESRFAGVQILGVDEHLCGTTPPTRPRTRAPRR